MEEFNIKSYLSRDEYDKVLNFINNKSKNKIGKNGSSTNNIINIDKEIIDFNNKWPFNNIEISESTEYMIATQSAKYSLSHTIHLDNMIEIFKKKMDEDASYFIRGITYKNFNYGEIKNISTTNKKSNKSDEENKQKSKTTKYRKNKMFDNQATLIIWSELSKKNINLKLFINGSGSMTGCRHLRDGPYILEKLIDEINKYRDVMVIKNKPEENTDTEDNNTEDNILKLINCNTTMMKSDFELKMCINRTELRNILLEKYKILTIYDPTIYPGVKICYMWNQENKYNDGVCHCSVKCKPRTKKKSGIGDCECITVTIIVFEKGKVVITGARNEKHTNDAYEFINKIIQKHSKNIIVNNIINI